MPQPYASSLLTVRQMAERLNLTLQRAYELTRTQALPVVRIGRQVRVDPAALERWIKNGGRPLRQ